MNNNNGQGMKRRLPQDPRQRMNQHQNRFPPQGGGPRMQGNGNGNGGRLQGGGRGPGPGPPFGRGAAGGRGFPMHHQQQGRGGPPNMNMSPPMGGRGMMNGRGPTPGRAAPPMMAGRGPMPPGRGLGLGMGGRQPMMHGQHSQIMGRGAPPPPPPQGMQLQRGPYPPPGAHMNHNIPNRMGHAPPPPPHGMGMGYGQSMGGRGAPPPPPGRQIYPSQQQPFHQQQPQQPPHLRTPQGSMMPSGQVQQQPQLQQQYRPGPTHYGSTNIPAHMPSTSQGATYSVNAQLQQTNLLAATSPKNVSTPYTQEQIDQAWTEHTNNGVKYYHNSISQESTYEKPKALQTQDKTATEGKHTSWTDYTDAKTGKTYYSNGVTTTWETPADYVSAAAIVAKSMEVEAATSAGSEPSKKRRKQNDKEAPFQNHEEAVAAFKGLMLAKGVSPSQKWNEVVKMCSSDSRWDDCEAALTTGERKQALAEYQTRRANELRTQERQERARAKDAYLQLLSEMLPKQPAFSTLSFRFSDVRDSISKDDRFYALPDEKTRESLFLDFVEELRKADDRKKRNKKREAQDSFCAFLKEKEEAGELSFSSTWNSFVSPLSDSDKDDSRFKVSPNMVESDRQLYFADFVIELQAAEDDKRRRIRDARRRAEKAQRDAYRDALEKLASEGKITPSSHWRDVERLIESDGSYAPVHEQDRDAPRDLFEEFSEEWDGIYRRDRQVLSQLVHPSSNREILVTVDTKYEAFVKALLEEASSSPQLHAEARRITKTDEQLSSTRLYFNELVKRAKDKHAVPLRRRGYGARRGPHGDSSSEDEGEIREDGEVEDEPEKQKDGAPASADTATTTAANKGQSADSAEEG